MKLEDGKPEKPTPILTPEDSNVDECRTSIARSTLKRPLVPLISVMMIFNSAYQNGIAYIEQKAIYTKLASEGSSILTLEIDVLSGTQVLGSSSDSAKDLSHRVSLASFNSAKSVEPSALVATVISDRMGQ